MTSSVSQLFTFLLFTSVIFSFDLPACWISAIFTVFAVLLITSNATPPSVYLFPISNFFISVPSCLVVVFLFLSDIIISHYNVYVNNKIEIFSNYFYVDFFVNIKYNETKEAIQCINMMETI